jgi:hypothetical protein
MLSDVMGDHGLECWSARLCNGVTLTDISLSVGGGVDDRRDDN